MSKAAKQSLFILIFLLLVALGFTGYIVLENNKLEEKVTFMNGELDRADETIKQKTKQVGSLNNEVKELTEVKLTLEQKLENASTKIEELSKNIETVTEERDTLDRRMGILREETEKINKELAALKARGPEIREKIVEVEKIVYKDREPDEKADETNEPLAQQVKDPLPTMSSDNEDYWASVLKKKAELELEIDSLKEELSTKALEVVELKKTNADLQLELDGLQHNKEDVAREIKYKTDLINNLSLELARSKNDKKFVIDRLEKVDEENKSLRTELKKLVSVKSSLEKSIVRLSDDKKKMAKQLEQTDGMVQSKIDEIWDIKESLDENFAMSRGMTRTQEVELPPIVINSKGSSEPAINFDYDQSTPGFDGRVVSINEENNFVIVDVGETKGIRLGDTLSVYRDSKYIARLEVIQVRKDIAAADIKDQWSRIKAGDIIR